MKNDLRELRQLATHFRNRTYLEGTHLNYLSSPAFIEQLDAIGSDPETLAKLSIQLLDHVALDPTYGSKVEDFIVVASDAETIFVNLQLNRLVNPVGAFMMRVTSASLPALMRAVQANLSSRMFKAAVTHRRLSHGNTRRIRRFEKAASAAFQAAYLKADASIAKPSVYASEDARYERQQEVRAAGDAAYRKVYQPLFERLDSRITAIGRQAATEGYREGFYDILVKFASTYICPALPEEACCA